MNRTTIIVSAIVFIAIVAGMFGFAQYKASLLEEPAVVSDDASQAGPFDYITRIDAKHYYIDGTHTLVGELLMPTPCDLLTTEVFVAESYPEQVSVQFDVINNAEFCSQVQTAQRFKVEAVASAEATFSATFQDRVVEINLVPAAEGETPEEFELFIKG